MAENTESLTPGYMLDPIQSYRKAYYYPLNCSSGKQEDRMHSIFYIIGVIVVVLVILRLLGLF